MNDTNKIVTLLSSYLEQYPENCDKILEVVTKNLQNFRQAQEIRQNTQSQQTAEKLSFALDSYYGTHFEVMALDFIVVLCQSQSGISALAPATKDTLRRFYDSIITREVEFLKWVKEIKGEQYYRAVCNVITHFNSTKNNK